jgi:hypothetical protein
MPFVAMPALAEEARYLHACLFARPVDPVTIARYEAAHREFGWEKTSSPVTAAVVARRIDAEAVEFALRRRGAGQELTRKMLMLCYFAEARSEYLGEFVNLRRSRARACAALLTATLRSMWKLGKGAYLIRRHGLV